MKSRIAILFALLTAAAMCRADEAVPAKLEFNRDVRSILSDKCFKCHGPDSAARQAMLRLDLRDDALAEHDGGKPIVPGKAEQSEVVRRIEADDDEVRMPPRSSDLRLTKAEIAVLRRWVAEGVEYQPHWSLVLPKAAPLPAVKINNWGRNGIDRFTLAVLEREGLPPSAEADKRTQLRRVTLALTGLPPTLAELDAFLADTSPQAYENVVDRLLRSPRFGERMALDWLDAARYADTNGYFTDAERVAWPWREWVIGAFNANLPFDRFTIEQLAGDLLPDATTAQRIATGFNRNHMVTNETGSIDEEFRLGYVADRVDTTATVWLGLTLGCARCHDHKFDAITQRDYYRLFAAFNSIRETGLVTEVAPLSPAPALLLPAFVVLISRGSAVSPADPLYARLWGSAFLPSNHQGVSFRSSGDPVLYLTNPDGVTDSDRRRMLTTLGQLNQQQHAESLDPEITTRIAQYEMAYRMQTSVPELTDLSNESAETFQRYGEAARTPGTFAANCLLARRLAERGCRFIQLYHRGWDQHYNLPTNLALQCHDVDQAGAALVGDLKRRGLLDDTLVVWGGEFGRTTYSQGKLTKTNFGRDHHGRCFTMCLAGGGVKPGITHGETDDYGYSVVRDPVHVHDLNATILRCFGLDHTKLTFKHQGRRYRLTDVEGHAVEAILGASS